MFLKGLYNEWETAPLTLPLPQGERSCCFEVCLGDFLSPPGERIKVRGLENCKVTSGTGH
jgi:hypothetical protein